MKMKRRARFATTSQMIVLVDRTKGIEDQLWYSEDDVHRFKLHAALHCEALRGTIFRGTFSGKLDDIVGLERLIYDQIYLPRRAALKASVLEEQAWQRLSKEMRRMKGLPDESSVGNPQIGVTRLADVSKRNSRWAKDRARVTALALEMSCKGSLSSRQASDIDNEAPTDQGTT